MVVSARWLGVCLVILCFFLLPRKIWAAVVINEFLPYPDSEDEWVEFYNPDGVDLSSWTLEEITSSGNITSHTLESIENNSTYDIFSFSQSKLNNGGDKLTLRDDKGQRVDEYEYTSSQKGISYARIPDGGDWSTLTQPTKGASNGNQPASSLSPSGDSSGNLESGSKAEYKINEVKDGDGNSLSSVKIYVDGTYVHHYAPETLTFCDGCDCGGYGSCGFGEHTIKLEKSGYELGASPNLFRLIAVSRPIQQ